MQRRCPTCKEPIPAERQKEPFAPFCSERCRLLDLGAWLDGEYRIPGPPAVVPDANLPAEDDDDG